MFLVPQMRHVAVEKDGGDRCVNNGGIHKHRHYAEGECLNHLRMIFLLVKDLGALLEPHRTSSNSNICYSSQQDDISLSFFFLVTIKTDVSSSLEFFPQEEVHRIQHADFLSKDRLVNPGSIFSQSLSSSRIAASVVLRSSVALLRSTSIRPSRWP